MFFRFREEQSQLQERLNTLQQKLGKANNHHPRISKFHFFLVVYLEEVYFQYSQVVIVGSCVFHLKICLVCFVKTEGGGGVCSYPLVKGGGGGDAVQISIFFTLRLKA